MAYTNNTTMLCHDHERSALLHFKRPLFTSSNSSANLKTASWKTRGNSSNDCCSWDGVECDDSTGYVISLDLGSSLIHATLHSNSTLFSLVHLQNLDLAENNFLNSSIPPEISHLSDLSFINLSSSFSGQIPLELSGMSKLTSLDLSNNYLHGGFPIAIFNLPGLLVFNLSENQNLSGYLPEFNQTSPFRELDIAWTNFSGSIPSSIGNLQSVTRLRLRNCYFSGAIPASIGNLTQLNHLSVASNMFNNSGDLSWLHKLTKLAAINLHDTNLYGDISPSLANLTELTLLSLSQNPFNKSRNLSWLDKLTKLTFLDLQNSNLFGDIPPSLANQSQLTHLILPNNYFVGQIPYWIWNSSNNLEVINLPANYLTVFERNSVVIHSKSLRFIDINNNMLQRNLPVPPPNTDLYLVYNNRFHP